MTAIVRDIAPPDHLAVILGCRMVGGSCVRHQPREWEPRRDGCPLVDEIRREGRNR